MDFNAGCGKVAAGGAAKLATKRGTSSGCGPSAISTIMAKGNHSQKKETKKPKKEKPKAPLVRKGS
jgi:hypothetical protein